MNLEDRMPDLWKQRLTASGGLLGALAAVSCCIVPLILFTLGVSGAWIGSLTQLAPYQPYFIAASMGLLGYGYWLSYRAPQASCGTEACAKPLPNRLVKIGLIVATILVVAAIAFDLLVPLLLNS